MPDKIPLAKQLRFCDLVLLENCMLKCKMCRMWKSTGDPELIPERIWIEFIRSLSAVASPDLQVQFVGGEPLLKKGICRLIAAASNQGFSTTMTTNAFLLDKRTAGELCDSGLSCITLSLDSLFPEVHDSLRGVKGVAERVMLAIGYFSERSRASRPKIIIVTTIMEPTLEGLVPLVKWAQNNEHIDHISFQAVAQPFFSPSEERWFEKEGFSFLWPKDPGKTEHVIGELISLKKNGYKIGNPAGQLTAFSSYFKTPALFIKQNGCNLGYRSITVNSSGDILLCSLLEPIGNIREGGLDRFWFSEKSETVRTMISSCQKNCKSVMNCFYEEENAKKRG